MANDDLLSGLGDSSFDDILRPVAPPAPSALERLSGILGNTIGLPKKGADALANAVADYIIGPGQHMSEGEMLKEAALPEDTSDHSYARTLGRAGIQTLGDIATDPLVQATMGAGAIANPINAATLAQAGKIPEALEAAKNASVAAGALKALNPAFTASMALGAAETVPPALKGLATQGLNPDTAAQLLQAGINVGGLAMGAKGTYQDFREPV
jgi:hypothetical protein